MIALNQAPQVGVTNAAEWPRLLGVWAANTVNTLMHPLVPKWPVYTTTVTVTLRREQDGLWLCDTTAGALTVNLPPLDIVRDGWYVLILKTDATANIVTLDGSGADPINGAATNTQIDAQYNRIGLVSTTTGWLIVEREV